MIFWQHAVEYWLPITLDTYLEQLQRQWLEKLGAMSPLITQYFAEEEIRDAFRMGYQGNMLIVWFPKEEVAASAITQLAEAPVAKDKWAMNDVEDSGGDFTRRASS
jgi:hypothetical protein